MVFRTVRYVFGLLPRGRRRELTFGDLDRMDIAYDEELTVFDLERAQLENGDLVGMTAAIHHNGLSLASKSSSE